MKTVDILSTLYSIEIRKYEDDPYFKEHSCDGYCNGTIHGIVLCDMHTYPGWEKESAEAIEKATQATLRHEIVHAFLNESGLQNSALEYGGAWAKNEEMIDWIAIQGPKIMTAWEKAGAL